MKRGKSILFLGSANSGWRLPRLTTSVPHQASSTWPIKPRQGFSLVELMVTVSLLATLLVLAVPSYTDSVNKRRISHAAEQIVSFLNLTQTEAIKRSKPMVISYSGTESGTWCIGAKLGETACDCTNAEPASSLYCGIETTPWLVGSSDSVAVKPVVGEASESSFIIDPARGLTRLAAGGMGDEFELGLKAGEGDLLVNIKLVRTGKVSVCIPDGSKPIGGFMPCTQDS